MIEEYQYYQVLNENSELTAKVEELEAALKGIKDYARNRSHPHCLKILELAEAALKEKD